MVSGQLVELRVQTKHGEAALSCYAAFNWNKLPEDLRCAPNGSLLKDLRCAPNGSLFKDLRCAPNGSPLKNISLFMCLLSSKTVPIAPLLIVLFIF